MKIVDSFIFYNELDLLEYRLKLLEPVVNNFVLVESTQTFAGHQKPLYYQENKDRFREYNHKIQHVVVDSFQPDDAWFNEKLQRESITQGLEMLRLHDDDAIMITDVDEIPDPRVIMQVGLNVEFRHMPMGS